MDKGMIRGLINAAKALALMAGIFIALYALLIFGAIFIGTLSDTVQSGDVPITELSNNTTKAVETSYASVSSTITDNVLIVLGFIALVVTLVILFSTGVIKMPGMGGKGGSGKADF